MNVIKKLFIKNYRNVNDQKVRLSYGRVAGTIGIICNIFLFAIKILIGIFTASITIVVDAINNLTAAGSSVLTFVGFKLASKPADRKHPFGHAKYENVMGLIISIITLVVGIIFVKSCIEKIIAPVDLIINFWTYLILGVAILVKIFMLLMYRNFAKSIDSEALRASANDSKLDIITSSTILVSMIIMGIFKLNIDGYVGLAVSIFVIYSGTKQILQTISPLISEKPERELVNKIKKTLLSFDGVESLHDLLIHSYGVDSTFASVHIEVPASSNLLDVHELIDKIERYFEDTLNINLTIQVDPIDKENPKTKAIYNKVKTTIKDINSKLSIHSLRVIYGKDRIKVLFDITEDYDINLKKIDVNNILQNAFRDKNQDTNETYEFIFTIDKPMV